MSLSSNFSKIELTKPSSKNNEVPVSISETSLKTLKQALEKILPTGRLNALGEFGGQSAENGERRSNEASQILLGIPGTKIWSNLNKNVAPQILSAVK